MAHLFTCSGAKAYKFGVRQKLSTMEERRVAIHPRSINCQTVDFESPFLVYHLKLKSSKIYLHDSTMVYPMPLLFFGENLQYFAEKGVNMVAVNDYIRFRCREETANLIMVSHFSMGNFPIRLAGAVASPGCQTRGGLYSGLSTSNLLCGLPAFDIES